MALDTPTELNLLNLLREMAYQIETLPKSNGKRGEFVAECLHLLGWKKDKFYRNLKKIGWESGKKTRSDKGTTSQDEKELDKLAAMQKISMRDNKKEMLSTPTGIGIAKENGINISVSPSQANKLMRDRKINIARQKKDRPHVSMRSLYANHVHQVDPSICVIYYLKDGTQGMMDEIEFNKNKPQNFARIENYRVWRYVLYDHASGVIIPWYVQSAGEKKENLIDFLMYAWGKKDKTPFHGVSDILYWDKGSANTSAALKNLLDALEVKHLTHARGNARAKGGVEGGNNIVERQFETRLRFEPIHSIKELNEKAANWAHLWNDNRLPGQSSLLRRKGILPTSRYALWNKTIKGHLRELPPVDVCKALISGKPEHRTVNPGMTISFKHPSTKCSYEYDLSGCEQIVVGDRLEVSPLLYGDREIKIKIEQYNGEDLEIRLQPIEYDSELGFRTDAAVWGEEYKAQPDTEVEIQGKKLDQIAYPNRDSKAIQKAKDKKETPFDGQINAHSYLSDIHVPDYLHRKGSEINVPLHAANEIKLLTIVEASKRLVVAVVGVVPEGFSIFNWVTEHYPEGIPEDQIPDLVEQIKQTQPATSSTSLTMVANNSTHKS